MVGGADGGSEHADATPGGAQEGIPPHQDTLETDLWSGEGFSTRRNFKGPTEKVLLFVLMNTAKLSNYLPEL